MPGIPAGICVESFDVLGTGISGIPWHFLNFFPLPQGQGSLRPVLTLCFKVLFTGFWRKILSFAKNKRPRNRHLTRTRRRSGQVKSGDFRITPG
jgi:hypothetical protein